MIERRTGGTEEAEAAVEAAERTVREAEETLRRAKFERWLAQMDEATARAVREVEITQDMPPREFAERVADAARNHGAECASSREVDTTRPWKRFRILLGALARRAEAAEEKVGRTMVTQADREVALLVREVICEAIHRRMASWDPEHPNRSLGIRDIPLDRVLSEFWRDGRTRELTKLDKAGLREYASIVLDRVSQTTGTDGDE